MSKVRLPLSYKIELDIENTDDKTDFLKFPTMSFRPFVSLVDLLDRNGFPPTRPNLIRSKSKLRVEVIKSRQTEDC